MNTIIDISLPLSSDMPTYPGTTSTTIDALGIRKFGSNDNTPHTALLSQGIPIIEGLGLSNAKPGTYILAAFPLAFGAIDGSPLRAVLIA